MVNTDKKYIGQIIQKYRKQAGLTQFELAEKINLSEKHISKIERGENIAKLDTFLKMAEVLSFTLSDFGIESQKADDNQEKTILLQQINLCNKKELKLFSDILGAIKSNQI